MAKTIISGSKRTLRRFQGRTCRGMDVRTERLFVTRRYSADIVFPRWHLFLLYEFPHIYSYEWHLYEWHLFILYESPIFINAICMNDICMNGICFYRMNSPPILMNTICMNGISFYCMNSPPHIFL